MNYEFYHLCISKFIYFIKHIAIMVIQLFYFRVLLSLILTFYLFIFLIYNIWSII